MNDQETQPQQPPEPVIQTAFVKDGALWYLDNKGKLLDVYRKASNFKIIDEPSNPFVWKGSKMPYALWEQVMGFLRWSQQEHKSESMLIFFYHAENRQWGIACFPQETNGMTVKLLETDPQYPVVRAQFGRGWVQFGSIHHHCTAGAFQSGTDSADELQKEGVHITIGKVEDIETESHARFVYKGICYPAKIHEWIEQPEWANQLPPSLKDAESECLILESCMGVPPPDNWKSQVKKPVCTPVTTYMGAQQADFWDSHEWSPKKGKYVPKEKNTIGPASVTQVTIEDIDAVEEYMRKNNLTEDDFAKDAPNWVQHRQALALQYGITADMLNIILLNFLGDEEVVRGKQSPS
jgi:hypothetical protein